MKESQINLTRIFTTISLHSTIIDHTSSEQAGAKPKICRDSEIIFEDGPISLYGKFITREEIPSLDFQFLVMKPNTEDAHVHDKETEIMLLWGGAFEVWTKADIGVQSMRFRGGGALMHNDASRICSRRKNV
ncbi:hypothetical protein [Paenibacillus ihuae]|uniref:hypothetical protein n=1 Tax=Paenibacillus ihuae TaxID=1232431 RepID=UPI0006D57D4E|nr:hypothetical protein [Paenibacillus ihuae]